MTFDAPTTHKDRSTSACKRSVERPANTLEEIPMSNAEFTALPAAQHTTDSPSEWVTIREAAIAQAAEVIRRCEAGGLPIDAAVEEIGDILRSVPPSPTPPTEAELAAALREFAALRAFIDARHVAAGVAKAVSRG